MSRRQNQERRHLRRGCPTLGIRFKAVPYRTMDWSLGGFAIKGSCPMLEGFKVGDEVTGSFGLPGCNARTRVFGGGDTYRRRNVHDRLQVLDSLSRRPKDAGEPAFELAPTGA